MPPLTNERAVMAGRIMIDVACGAVALTLAVSAGLSNDRLGRHPVNRVSEGGRVPRPRSHGAAKVDSVAILAIGATLWPILFDATAGFRALARAPSLWLAFIWPLATIGFDLGLGAQSTIYKQVMHQHQRPTQGPAEANAVLGVALAIGSILATKGLEKGGPRSMKLGMPLLMAGVALTIAFVLPVPTVDPASDIGITIRTAQSGVFFNYAVGLMLGAILVSFSVRAKGRDLSAVGSGAAAAGSGATTAAAAALLV